MKSREIKRFFSGYYQYFIVGALFIVLVIILALSKRTDAADEEPARNEQTTEASEDDVEVNIEYTPFETDAYPQVNDLISRLYDALGAGDVDTVRSMCTEYSDTEARAMEQKAEFIEAYSNVECNTKPGPGENEFIVFVYYEIKFHNIDTMAPGLTSYYLKTKEDGSLYIDTNSELDAYTKKYLKLIYDQEDVQELIKRVDTRYKEALGSDETLKNFMEKLPTVIDPTVDPAPSANELPPEGITVKILKTVNVREQPNTNAGVLGKKSANDTITVLEIRDDGWSRVDFQGQEAYVSSEFLDLSGGGSAPASDGAAAETPAQTESTGSSSGGNASKIRIKGEGVNVRNKPSKDGDYLGIGGNGYEYEVKGTEGDWYKIDFKGQDGYVKKDFAEPI